MDAYIKGKKPQINNSTLYLKELEQIKPNQRSV